MFVFILALAVAAGYFINQFYFISPPAGAGISEFTIESGESAGQIAQELKGGGIIKNKFAFDLYVRISKNAADFKTGEFTLRPGMSMAKISDILTAAENAEAWVTLIEGWTLRNYADKFESSGLFSDMEFFEQTGLPAEDSRALSLENPTEKWKQEFSSLADKPEKASLEGYLFPDTYKFFLNASAEDTIRRILQNFDKKLRPEWRAEITRQGKSIFEIITMASIIEKEMYGLEDRKMVSDIFWKRLELGMALQSDASVNYVTGKGLTRPSLEDLEVDSPYNTYKYPGLPFGPICNPGAEAIEAAIYPTPNEYYYFLTTPDGEIIYSRTHDEHVANKRRFLNGY